MAIDNIRLIALDLDGTLALDNHQVSNATRIALETLHQNNVEVVISTGRRFRTAQYVIDNLGFEVYCICNGGALVKNPKQETILQSPFSKTEVEYVISLARSHEVALSAQRDAHTIGGADFIIDNVPDWHPSTLAYFKNNKDYAGASDLLRDLKSEQTNYLAFSSFDHEDRLRPFIKEIQADSRFNALIVAQTNGSEHYCEVTLQHVDKWYGLSHIADEFGLQAKNICAVGDELNDLPMVNAAGLGVAMGNAHPDLKNIADFICGKHDEDGLLDVVEKIYAHNA